MPFNIENMTRMNVLLRFASGRTLHLGARSISDMSFLPTDLGPNIVKQEERGEIQYLNSESRKPASRDEVFDLKRHKTQKTAGKEKKGDSPKKRSRKRKK